MPPRVEGGEGGELRGSSGRDTDVALEDNKPIPMGSATERGTVVESGGAEVSPCACADIESEG